MGEEKELEKFVKQVQLTEEVWRVLTQIKFDENLKSLDEVIRKLLEQRT